MKQQVKQLIQEIKVDRKKRLILSDKHLIQIQGMWLEMFGTGGCDHYPYLTIYDQLTDLAEHYKLSL